VLVTHQPSKRVLTAAEVARWEPPGTFWAGWLTNHRHRSGHVERELCHPGGVVAGPLTKAHQSIPDQTRIA